MTNTNNEIWLPVVGYEDYYEVSNLGRVKSMIFQNHRILKEHISLNGYCRVGLRKDGKQKTLTVHRIVAKAFIHNTNRLPEVNHKDHDKRNNHVSNLEWCTAKENTEHDIKVKGFKHRREVYDISTGVVFDSIKEAVNAYGLNYWATYAKIVNRNPNDTNLRYAYFK